MYSAYWQLNRLPFQTSRTNGGQTHGSQNRGELGQPNSASPRWASWQHDEALARLLFVVESQKPVGLVTGPMGMGKTFLLQQLRAQMPTTQYRLGWVNMWGLTGDELLHALAAPYLPVSRQQPTPAQNWQTVVNQWQSANAARIPVILFLDHFDQARPDAVPTVERLIHALSGQVANATILLAARSQQAVAVSKTLIEAVQLRIELEPFSQQETASYVASALEWSGRVEPIFDETGLQRLHELSEGVPQKINQLCELALIAGMGESVTTIDAALVERVGQELWASR